METEQNVSKKLLTPFGQFRSYTLRHADFVVACNSEAVELMESKGDTGPTEVVPNAVDAEIFRLLNRETCRDTLGISGL